MKFISRAAPFAALTLSAALLGCAQPAPPTAAATPVLSATPLGAEADARNAIEARKHRIDAVIDAAVAEGRIVGTVAIVLEDGKVVYHRAAGFADREAQKPMREDTIFRLASATKPIVSATALALVERGIIGLDDPITKWLPEFRPRLTNGRVPIITVRHLLTHTSGLNYSFAESQDGPYHRAHVSDGIDQPGLSLEENLARITKAPLLFEPGSRWNYSLSIDVLGAIIAKAGGAPLPELVQRFITGPLQIDTSFTTPDPSLLAIPYADGKPQPIRMTDPQLVPFGGGLVSFSPSRVTNPRSYPSGGGGMLGTAKGYATFLETLRTGSPQILRPSTIALMTTNQIGPLDLPGSNGTLGFTFGFSILKKSAPPNPSAPGTLQWGGIWGHHYFIDPSTKLTTVVLTNTATAGMTGPFPEAIALAIYQPQ